MKEIGICKSWSTNSDRQLAERKIRQQRASARCGSPCRKRNEYIAQIQKNRDMLDQL